ncbi:Protein of unknown function [Cotesia congregata]|uniref:Uncharacterized protein n=1 Tax=Cotesia congregata TaxID=51543 RepID=A0A8J2HD85_COTCN|nr:Protein of unknown function [Cotesia congregata]
MDKLISSDENLRQIINDFKINFIEKELQKCFIEFGNYKMTMYDFFMHVFDPKKLKLLAREEDLPDALSKVFKKILETSSHFYYLLFEKPIKLRIEDARIKLKLLEYLEKISSLRVAIPLPFELVLDIVEYLNIIHLYMFMQAFYSSCLNIV